MLPDNFTIVISRTDSIGDVILTLPMAGYIKKFFPRARIFFLGRTYTKDVIELSSHVDHFINYDEIEKLSLTEQLKKVKALRADVFLHVFPNRKIAALARKAGIGLRVGTTNRIYHWFNCNKLIALSRKNSPFHESQLNIQLLRFLKIDTSVSLAGLAQFYGLRSPDALPERFVSLLDATRYNLILHPRSKGSAIEWGLDNFKALAEILPADRFRIFISGTAKDAESMPQFLKEVNATDITGKMNLKEFISFIYACDGLIAASTGPLHISAALGRQAVGLFSSRRPIHPGRWQPIGERALALVFDRNCPDCAAGKQCHCITKIAPETLAAILKK